MELLGNTACLTSWESGKPWQHDGTTVYSQQQRMRAPVAPLCICYYQPFYILAMVLSHISLITNGFKHLFKCLLAILLSSSVKNLVKYCAHILIISLLSCKCSFIPFWIQLLHQHMYCKCFHPVYGPAFSLLRQWLPGTRSFKFWWSLISQFFFLL